jgi:hypothetical protein
MGGGTAKKSRWVMGQWTAQWAADNCRQCRSGAIGGDIRLTTAVITIDGGGMIAMDGGSGDGQQWQHSGWQDGRVIAMGNETAAAA